MLILSREEEGETYSLHHVSRLAPSLRFHYVILFSFLVSIICLTSSG